MCLYKGGLYTGGGAYTWTIFCVSVIVINKYSNSDKQVLSIVIIMINSGNISELIIGWANIRWGRLIFGMR
jgi:hypothetical protein